jgi:hypothetical protein
MKSSYQFGEVWIDRLRLLVSSGAMATALLVAAFFTAAHPAAAQVAPSGDKGGFSLTAGATASGYEVGYGQQKLLGIAAVVDVDSRRRFGLEGEARWLQFHQDNDVHVNTWLAGPRYHFSRGKLQYYGKGLVGEGKFQFPYDYAHGSYLVVGGGGGVDYHWKRKISIRVADFEYQYWPQFTYGAMSSYGVSVGLQYHIF